MISINEIKSRALAFSREWDDARSEEAEAQTFLKEFFRILDIKNRKLTIFEKNVHKIDDTEGYIDMLWKGKILVEMKSRGKDLEKAYEQAKEYALALNEKELPRYILICDFYHFHLYDLDEKEVHKFTLDKLHENIMLFAPLIGYKKVVYKDQDPVNIEAAERMGKLHDKLKEIGYEGHELEVYLVRLLFCLFADDTSIFPKQDFINFITNRTAEDGSDLAGKIAELFQTLNTPTDRRLKNLDESLIPFPFVNGRLFDEKLSIASFDREMRELLIDCCSMDWSKISPALFGAMFQSIMNPEERRNLGAHYTSEKNIQKVLHPLFLDELKCNFKKAGNNPDKLKELHSELSKMRFLDPACGCGNFLITTYKELRLLELEIVKKLYTKMEGEHLVVQLPARLKDILIVDVDQFYGIEHEEFPARIAEVALWLIDHQMNIIASETFGEPVLRLPLEKHGNILNADSLNTDWTEFFPKTKYNYILGNPPFVGSRIMNAQQKEQVKTAYNNMTGAGDLDYVTVWYLKAAQYIQNTNIKVAFVSTNSICQGLQASILWGHLMSIYNIKIHFAHQTFKWSNEARGNAAVYCIIVGFANYDTENKAIYRYEDIKGEAHKMEGTIYNINNYLLNAETVIISRRQNAISDVPEMSFGNMPLDGGNLLFTDEEKKEFLAKEPKAKKYILPLISAKEFLNSEKRWCLWLKDEEPDKLKAFPEIMKRVQAVQKFRQNSRDAGTRKKAQSPTTFRDTNRPKTYLLIPSTSSEIREYIPMAFFGYKEIANNSCHIIPNATLYHFGILQSILHMEWVNHVCGRLESRYRYSKDIVYNNFVFPEANDKQKEKIEKLAQDVLDARANHPKSTLANLYNPLIMPADLRKAHNALDRAVDRLYGITSDSDSARMVKLLALYKEKTAPLEAASKPKRKTRKKKDQQ